MDTLAAYLGDTGFDVARFEPAPGRESLVARIEGTDPSAPALCLMGHIDVVPVDPAGWTRDPFAGERVGDEIWGRGAVDMLNLTASMAVAFRQLALHGPRFAGDLVFFAAADEESGGEHGIRWLAKNEPDAIRADYVLTENGGLHNGAHVGVKVAEKGVAWHRLRVRGTAGHGARPWRADNALARAAQIIQRLTDYRPAPRLDDLWRLKVATLDVPDDLRAALLDPARLDDCLGTMPNKNLAAYLHACTHTTFSCNVVSGPMKTNVIPGTVDLDVDVRSLPGEDADEVRAHLVAALGDLLDDVDVDIFLHQPANASPTATPLWDSLQRAVNQRFPASRIGPELAVGLTDARIYRDLGAVAYGAGLFSPTLDPSDYARRFHGDDERIDLESLALSTRFWIDVVSDFLG
ncbi:M20/M25/M40 family metallo-hydrolase [Pseudofrankia sp. BMG5.36]|uniref:M20/M25/M40 family metallo-hydrolase n=1 Tax=Pseudofrankia sp. BMG5.36 TaxID=1834512 RepID=UPI0018E37B57|nr:M20/M25/M40 family metallo-hydrolase [Pseudofrankia sp. BMG5.36]